MVAHMQKKEVVRQVKDKHLDREIFPCRFMLFVGDVGCDEDGAKFSLQVD